MTWRLLAMVSFTMGLAFLLGGPSRVSADAYTVVRETGGPYVWGAGFIGSSLGVVASGFFLRRVLHWALWAAGAGFFVLAFAFGIAAWRYPGSNFTAPVIYAWVGVMYSIKAEKAREERAWTHHRGTPWLGG